jgi:hypothetical protein
MKTYLQIQHTARNGSKATMVVQPQWRPFWTEQLLNDFLTVPVGCSAWSDFLKACFSTSQAAATFYRSSTTLTSEEDVTKAIRQPDRYATTCTFSDTLEQGLAPLRPPLHFTPTNSFCQECTLVHVSFEGLQ